MSATAPRPAWPDTLTADEIDRRFITLRERRETLMRSLRAAELRADGDPASAIDGIELRLRLNALLAEWRQLLARLLTVQDWAPLGSEAPAFAELAGDDRHRVARARVPLTPDSLLFVHGPVTLWHAAALAEDMLAPGDRLVRLVRGAFHRELTVEPRILVWDTAQGAPPVGYDPADVAVDGGFVTARGRQLSFVALADSGIVPVRRAGWHPLTAGIIAARPPKEVRPTAFHYRLPPAPLPYPADRASSVVLAKVEAVIAVFTQHILVGERVFLLSRALDLTLDADLDGWLAQSPDIAFELDWSRHRPIPGRGGFVPMRYRIAPEDADWHRSLFVCLDSHLDF